ncbi:MAG: hypothetical protein V5789_09520 [Colwellia sp.]
MWQLVALILTVVGTAFLYLSNKNQRVIIRPLAKAWRLIGGVFCVLSLAVWWQLLVTSAAIFTWIFTLSIALVCLPLLTLFNRFENQQGQK